jgi:hypothetical protein
MVIACWIVAIMILAMMFAGCAHAQSTCEGGYRCSPLPYGRGSEECSPSRECNSGYGRENERRPENYERDRERFPGYHEPGERRPPQPYYGEGD